LASFWQGNTITPLSGGVKKLVRLRRHDEIVAVQPEGCLSPPLDNDPAPFDDKRRALPLFFGKVGNLIRKIQRFDQVSKLKDALQAWNAIRLARPPPDDVEQQLFDFYLRETRLTLAAGEALTCG
jgi:hypothetical protein